MSPTILPAFVEFPAESQIIGRLLAGYGEIEFELANCLVDILGNSDAAMRTLFRLRSETQRIDVADALRPVGIYRELMTAAAR